MPNVIITEDCRASENGIDIIDFKKSQIVGVSDPLGKILMKELKTAKPYTDAAAKKAREAAAEAALTQAQADVSMAEKALEADKEDIALLDALKAANAVLETLTKD